MVQERITRGNYGDERFTYSVALVFSQCVGGRPESVHLIVMIQCSTWYGIPMGSLLLSSAGSVFFCLKNQIPPPLPDVISPPSLTCLHFSLHSLFFARFFLFFHAYFPLFLTFLSSFLFLHIFFHFFVFSSPFIIFFTKCKRLM
jgi:hypothetical protein